MEFDVIVSLDCAEYHRIGVDIKHSVKHRIFLNIDHHASNNNFGDVNLIDTAASCVGEIVLDIIDSFKIEPTKTMAEALYVSVLTDTGSFKYGSTSVKAFKMASRLVEYGAEPWTISSNLYENSPLPKLTLLREVLGTLFVDESGLFASIEITKDSLARNNANKDMTDGFVNYPRSIKGVDIAIVFRELDNKVKLSVRSTGVYNVSDFCSKYGGGGHEHAAGCYIEGSLQYVKQKVFSDLNAWLKKK